MKNLKLLTAALAVLLLSGPNAFALSIEQRDTMNSDGTPKFADPDEQMPAGLTAPDEDGGSRSYNTSPSVNAPTLPQMMGVDQGTQSFDHAYNHVTNQNQ